MFTHEAVSRTRERKHPSPQRVPLPSVTLLPPPAPAGPHGSLAERECPGVRSPPPVCGGILARPGPGCSIRGHHDPPCAREPLGRSLPFLSVSTLEWESGSLGRCLLARLRTPNPSSEGATSGHVPQPRAPVQAPPARQRPPEPGLGITALCNQGFPGLAASSRAHFPSAYFSEVTVRFLPVFKLGCFFLPI